MDLYSGIIKRDASKGSVMGLMRVLCGVFVAASLVIASLHPTAIVNLMVISWGVLAGSFLAPYVYGLFWRRTTTAGATAGLFSGLGTAIALYLKLGVAGVPVSGAIAIIVPVIVVPIVSLLTKPVPKEIVARAFSDGTLEKQRV